ncbi:helix-turn-helix domain-containing protein [Domibacillus tundrae]|uniref:helix-turn-helix domain-containing protein n=1 Tax=Domibacillus tundrae TaxID=1587527 RepID=UPI00339B5540
MNTILKVTGALADGIRYSIYDYILKGHANVTVQDAAAEFNIHPIVARLHLTKLEDANLIASFLHKTGRGGRPGKVYKLAARVGYAPQIEEIEGRPNVQFVICNCPFKQLLYEKAAITCRIHKAFLQGVMQALVRGNGALSKNDDA